MAEDKKQIEKKVYKKNFVLKDFGPIAGLEVSPAIDKALNDALSEAKTKASDYHATPAEWEQIQKASKLSIGIKQVAVKKS